VRRPSCAWFCPLCPWRGPLGGRRGGGRGWGAQPRLSLPAGVANARAGAGRLARGPFSSRRRTPHPPSPFAPRPRRRPRRQQRGRDADHRDIRRRRPGVHDPHAHHAGAGAAPRLRRAAGRTWARGLAGVLAPAAGRPSAPAHPPTAANSPNRPDRYPTAPPQPPPAAARPPPTASNRFQPLRTAINRHEPPPTADRRSTGSPTPACTRSGRSCLRSSSSAAPTRASTGSSSGARRASRDFTRARALACACECFSARFCYARLRAPPGAARTGGAARLARAPFALRRRTGPPPPAPAPRARPSPRRNLRIRQPDMSPSPGVVIEDMGHKMGCNGVDNGAAASVWGLGGACVPVSRARSARGRTQAGPGAAHARPHAARARTRARAAPHPQASCALSTCACRATRCWTPSRPSRPTAPSPPGARPFLIQTRRADSPEGRTLWPSAGGRGGAAARPSERQLPPVKPRTLCAGRPRARPLSHPYPSCHPSPSSPRAASPSRGTAS
jgi:hypothetical protein